MQTSEIKYKCSTCGDTEHLCFTRGKRVLCHRCQKIEDLGLEKTDFLAKYEVKYRKGKDNGLL